MGTPQGKTRSRALGACLALALLLTWPVAGAGAAPRELMDWEFAFGSALQPGQRFLNPVGIATDLAGRVYVVDRGARRVEVYDSATGGHRLLRVVGEGRLVDPVDVDVSERDRLYVVDQGANRVDVYDQYIRGSAFLETLEMTAGADGTEVPLAAPAFVRVDGSGRAHVTEQGGLRVSIFNSITNGGRLAHNFRVGGDATFSQPTGIAVNRDGRIYVANGSPTEGRIRYWRRNGAFEGELSGPGPGRGRLSAPHGVIVDGFGRLVVADTGNHRLQVFGADHDDIHRYGGQGPGKDQLDSPMDLAQAPGALLYVTDAGNGRVVRLRYDDVDGDQVPGARDNCPSDFNPSQADFDGDGEGDACDRDPDGDLVAQDLDECPNSAPKVDRNRDGCGDPRSVLSRPRHRRTYSAARAARIRGRAFGDKLGVRQVEVAVRRVRRSARSSAGGPCVWYSKAKRGWVRGSCVRPKFFTTRGGRSWSVKLRARAMGPGLYTVMARATQRGGETERVFSAGRNLARFRVR